MIPVKNIAMLDFPWAPSGVCRGLYLGLPGRTRFFCTEIISPLPATPPWWPLFLCVRTLHKRGWKSGSVPLWGNCRVETTEQSWMRSHSAWDTSPAMRWIWTSEKSGSLTDWHFPWCPKQPVELDSYFMVEKCHTLGLRPYQKIKMSELRWSGSMIGKCLFIYFWQLFQNELVYILWCNLTLDKLIYLRQESWSAWAFKWIPESRSHRKLHFHF